MGGSLRDCLPWVQKKANVISLHPSASCQRELRNLACRNLDLGTGFSVAALSRLALRNGERSETDERNLLALLQCDLTASSVASSALPASALVSPALAAILSIRSAFVILVFPPFLFIDWRISLI